MPTEELFGNYQFLLEVAGTTGDTNEIAIETMTIAHEGIERAPAATRAYFDNGGARAYTAPVYDPETADMFDFDPDAPAETQETPLDWIGWHGEGEAEEDELQTRPNPIDDRPIDTYLPEPDDEVMVLF